MRFTLALNVNYFSGEAASGVSKFIPFSKKETMKLFPALPEWFWVPAGIFELSLVSLIWYDAARPGVGEIGIDMAYAFLGGVFYAVVLMKNPFTQKTALQKVPAMIIPPLLTAYCTYELSQVVRQPPLIGTGFVIGGIIAGHLVKTANFNEVQSKRSTVSKSKTFTDNDKFSHIMKVTQEDPLVYLGDKNFTQFIVDRPRNYHAVLVLTATGKQYKCSICVKTKQIYSENANYYFSQYGHDLNNTELKSRLVFFIAEVDDARQLFNDLEVETIPRVYILPATEIKSPKMKMNNHEVDVRVLMEGSSGLLDAINQAIGIKINVTVDPMPYLVLLCIISILIALLVSAASFDFYKALLWYQNTNIWIIVSSICFAVGVSGSIFCIIKSAPLLGHTRQGALTIFATQGRDQFLLEGIIVAFWTIGCGIAISLLIYSTKLSYSLLRHAGVILSMVIFIILSLQIWDAYVDKTGWYHLKDTFPPEVWHWFSSTIKKSSSLPKRLFRISEIWLYETKDLIAFRKKFDLLIIDYLKRWFQSIISSKST
eukprot:gene5135-7151_t